MSVRVDLHQFDYLKKEHVVNPPSLNVDDLDLGYRVVLVGSVGRAVCELLREGLGYDVPVFSVRNEQISGSRVPYIFVYGDEEVLATRVARLLKEYFAEDLEISIIPLIRFNDL